MYYSLSGYIFTSSKKVTCRLNEYDAFLNKHYIIDENEPLSFGHNHTNDAIYSKINFKVEIFSAL